MARRPRSVRRVRRGLDVGLTARGRAVMKAFHDARLYAPGFVVSCGVLPEVSESASERLHTIVREVAERHFDGRRHMISLQKRLRQQVDSAEATDRIGRNLTELIGSEATAAYLFGLAVGLTIQALPDRLNRQPR